MSETPRTKKPRISVGPSDDSIRELETVTRERDALRAEVEKLRKLLTMAVTQNEFEMLMTGEECRACRKALQEPTP